MAFQNISNEDLKALSKGILKSGVKSTDIERDTILYEW